MCIGVSLSRNARKMCVVLLSSVCVLAFIFLITLYSLHQMLHKALGFANGYIKPVQKVFIIIIIITAWVLVHVLSLILIEKLFFFY